MVSIIFIEIFILISSFITGRLMNYLFFKSDKDNTWLGVGFFAFLGLLQPFTYIITSLAIPTKFMLITFLLIPLILFLISLFFKVNLIPSKNDLFASIVGIIIVTIGLIRIQSYTLGETYLDSTFYLSMVNENSTKYVYGRMNYYSGVIQDVDFTYDYASFYALFSMLLKLVRNLGISEPMQTPLYFYSSTITFLYFFGVTLYTVSKRFFTKKIFTILLTIISTFIFFKYYNYALAFIGNSYRVISITYPLMFIYDFFYNEEKKTLLLVGILFSGLISVSSSGGFMSLFSLASLIIYLIFKNYDKEIVTYSLYALIPTLLFLNLVIYQMSNVAGYALFIFIVIYYLINYYLNKTNKFINKWYLLHKIIVILALIIMIVLSYFIQLETYSYQYFFNDHSAYDMVHDYFSIYHKNVFYPTLVVWFVLLFYFITKQKVKDFKFYLLTIVILFLNPLVTPFIIKYLTNFVFYRAFEIMFNFTTIAIFISSLSVIKNKYIINILCIIGCVVIIPFSYNQFTNNYSKTLIPTEDYNPYYRITNQEVDLYKYVNEVISKETDRVILLSQIPSTKAYVNDIELPYSVYDTRTSDHYADVKQDAPSELMNIFFLRDYVGQQIYSTNPNYENANELLLSNDIDYLIMRKDQAIDNNDGTYQPIYLNIREIADILYENDRYVFMKIRY